jgi:hypothetical protein
MRDGEGTTASSGKRAALVLAIVSVTLLVTYVVGGAVGWWELALDQDTFFTIGMMLGFLALGQLILWRAGGNRVGWIFMTIGLSLLVSAIAAGLADRGLIVFHALGGAFWLSWILLIGTLVLWFPTGEVPSRRWLWLQWFGFALLFITFFAYMFTEQVCVSGPDSERCVWAANPIGITGVPDPEFGWLSGPIFGLFAVYMCGALWSLLMRYRKAGTVERLQLKWFLLACASFVASLVTEVVLSAQGFEVAPLPVDIWITVSLVGIPVAATLAILRYRLYDIDRIISRTVSYAIVIAALAAVYAVGLTALTSLLDADSPLAVAGSTLAAAALFNPIRRRVQGRVDHRFNRTRYDAERVIAGFTGSLRDEVDPGMLVGGWVDVVSETMRPVSAGVWLRDEA